MSYTSAGEKRIGLKGDIPAVGSTAPNFNFTKQDFRDSSLSEFGAKKKVIIAVPSLDTGVCQTETRRFNKELAGKDGVVGLVISKDLPVAMKRFCVAEGIDGIEIGSDFKTNFVENYNLEMLEGPLPGLSARAVFVLDKDNVIRHSELTEQLGQEPDYDKVMSVLDSI